MAEDGTISPMQVRAEDFVRTVSALFDDRDQAETARADLIAAGLPRDAITLTGAEAGQETEATEPQKEGFWETLKELFMPEEDRYSYAEGIRRGGVTLSVTTDTATHDRVIDILDRDGAVDLDEREDSWRSEGWTGYTARDPFAGRASRQPGTATPTDETPVYERPSDATAGFAASAADQFPVDAAPPIESPGALPEAERVPAADAPYVPTDLAPGASAAPPVEPVPPGSGPAGSPIDVNVTPRPPRDSVRDLSHGRSRIRAYIRAQETGRTSDEGS